MNWRRLTLFCAPFVSFFCYFVLLSIELPHAQAVSAAVALLCALWWVFEPIPIPATSMIPFIAFPLLGVLSHTQVANAYGHTLILLLLGGFVLSTAMERSGAHKRIAFLLINFIGLTSTKRLLLGFMCASAMLSMWISNTATTLMLLPVALAALNELKIPSMTVPLLLGIAFAASVGGMGTPIGTPPNLVFLAVYREATGSEISFLAWMLYAVPIVVLAIPLMWLWIGRSLKTSIDHSLPELGAWTAAERRVLVIFGLTAFLWVTRTAPFGGWQVLLDLKTAGDSTVALLGAVLLFLVPDGKGEKLLDWETANKIPWGILILFGGGLAIAEAFEGSGLSLQIGELLLPLFAFPVFWLLLVLCLLVSFLTEVTSNTATSTLLMPILAAAAVQAGHPEALLMAPAALSASCAFMLPVATAPNAIMFASERFTIHEMAKIGLLLNCLLALLITIGSYFLLPIAFDL